MPVLSAELETIDRLQKELRDYRIERVHIAAILRTFYLSDVSMSSIQPVLQLAIDLNGPDLQDELKNMSRVDSIPEGAHGDLPRPATE